ncbi:MAG: bacteriocin [Saprospiraceae bacterium]|nr:bacteriocin [Saprospiraceae bacterium]
MTKLKGVTLQELATTLASGKEMSKEQLNCVKGGCSSCEDTRRPPRIRRGKA